MITCSIVGGETAKRLADYINSNAGGSLEIQEGHIFESFTDDENTIKNNYIKVQKLIYLIDESTNISSDLKVLYELMQSSAFFKVDEIWIFGKDNEVNAKGVNYFERIMSDLKFSNYFIRLNEGETPYREIYREITGVTNTDDNEVQYVKIYRAQRDDDSHKGYDPKPYNHNIELKSDRDSVKSYEDMKKASVLSETNRVVKDSPERVVPKIDLHVQGIDIESVIYNSNILIFSGNPKAGTSVFASSMAVTLAKLGRTVNLVDISGNCGSARRCLRIYKNRTLVNNEDLLTGSDYSNKSLAIYNTATIRDVRLKPAYLKYLLSIPNRSKSDMIIIDCGINELEEVVDICGPRVKKVFICAQQVKDEVVLVEPYIKRVTSKKLPVMIYLNNSIKFDKSYQKITPVQTKELCGDVKVISPTNFDEEVDLSPLLN